MRSIEEWNEHGWYISKEGCDLISEDGLVVDSRTLINKALNTDIKEFGAPILASEIKKNTTGRIILQIQKIRNISAPKNNEESQVAPRMLRLTLTDGHTSCQAIEIVKLPFLSRTDTAPGSKLLINLATISSGCILLYPGCCSLLGGIVPTLYNKWELAKNVSNHIRSTAGIDGPPPWVSFGEKIASLTANEQFKSLTAKTSKETTNNFDIQRQDAIAAVASTGAVKKIFGGGAKTVSLADSQPWTRKNRNNYQETKSKGKREVKESEKLQKPTEKISLFEFFEDKLVINDVDSSKTTNCINSNDNKSEKQPQKSKSRFNQAESASYNLESNLQSSRSCGQHFNLASNNFYKNINEEKWNWKVGDLCMAKYWEDEKYYNAIVTNLTERTCVVQFNDYGNIEEVLKIDCIPISSENKGPPFNSNTHYKGSARYRNYKRPYSNNRTFNKVP